MPCAGSRIVRIHRHIRGAGLEDREDANDHVRRALDEETDEVARPHTGRPQVVCQPVCAFVQLAITQPSAFVNQRDVVWPARHLLLEELMQANDRRRSGHRPRRLRGEESLVAFRHHG